MLSNVLRIEFGKKAQSQVAIDATPKPPMRLPAKYIGTHVNAEHRMFSATAARNESYVRTPKTRKISAKSHGYTGGIQAVGPVSTRNGELKPCPLASDAAMFPDSCKKGRTANACREFCPM
jgi:hypothetical protein